jgi:hypothetical protein
MKGVRPVQLSPVILVLIAFSAMVHPPMAHPMQLQEGATASGGGVSRSENCTLGREQDEQCLLRMPGGPASPGGPIHPPLLPPAPPEPPPLTPLRLPAGPPPHPHFPETISGTARATLHIHDADQDVTYDSDLVELIFSQRPEQDMPGTTQYVLESMSDPGMTWTAKGRRFDCTIGGKAMIHFPPEDQDQHPSDPTPGWNEPLDVTRPAFGYVHLVGPDGGDYHHIMVKMTDPKARVTKTCPGPMVTEEPLQAAFLLHVVWEKNRYYQTDPLMGLLGDRLYGGDRLVSLKGQLSFDQGNPLDALNLLPPGPAREIALHLGVASHWRHAGCESAARSLKHLVPVAQEP